MSDDFLFPAPRPVSAKIANSDLRFPVRRIFCVGKNYSEHIHEMGGRIDTSSPIFFTKPADALIGNNSSIAFPLACNELHHEVELVIALNQPLLKADTETCRAAIFGMATGIDLTRRDLQAIAKKNRQPWDTAKAFDHSAPMGDIVQTQEFPANPDLAISLWVNGQLRQSANINQMIWPVEKLLSQLSHLFHLLPGDLVFTGTPAGVGPVRPGDKITAMVEGAEELNIQICPSE